MKKATEAEKLLNRFANCTALLSCGGEISESDRQRLNELRNSYRAEILELLNKAMKD